MGVRPGPGANVRPMPRQPVDPNSSDGDEFYEPKNERIRKKAAKEGTEPLSINDIAEMFGRPAATVRRQWIYERHLVKDPRRRFPLPTWPGQNPRWARSIVEEWGAYTKRFPQEGGKK